MAVALVALLRILLYISCGIVAISFIAVVLGWLLKYVKAVLLPLAKSILEESNDNK